MSGKWFDELEVGQVFQHALRRTLTETDNLLFTTMTHNPAQLHLDAEYCKNETEFGGVLMNSMFTMGLVVGISVGDTTLGTAVANLSIDNATFPKPLFPVILFALKRKSSPCARASPARCKALSHLSTALLISMAIWSVRCSAKACSIKSLVRLNPLD